MSGGLNQRGPGTDAASAAVFTPTRRIFLKNSETRLSIGIHDFEKQARLLFEIMDANGKAGFGVFQENAARRGEHGRRCRVRPGTALVQAAAHASLPVANCTSRGDGHRCCPPSTTIVVPVSAGALTIKRTACAMSSTVELRPRGAMPWARAKPSAVCSPLISVIPGATPHTRTLGARAMASSRVAPSRPIFATV